MTSSLYNQQKKHNEIAGRFKLEWQTPQNKGTILMLVEGPSDKTFYNQFVADYTAVRSCGGGCTSMIGVFRDLKRFSSITCLAIKDGDFDVVNGTEIIEEGLFYTDYHDHEMFFLSSKDLVSTTFSSFAIPFDQEDFNSVLSSLSTLTYLKWYNYTKHINLVFRGIKTHCISCECLLNKEYLIETVLGDSSDGICFDLMDFDSFRINHSFNNVFCLINGHDLLGRLYAYANERLRINITLSTFKRRFIENYSYEAFSHTDLYNNVTHWAEKRCIKVFC